MAELKTVLAGLRQCMMASNRNEFETQCMDCPYFNPEVTVEECMEPLREDTFVLLKAQQGEIEQMEQEIERLKAKPPKSAWIHRSDMDYKDKNGVVHFHGMCENCGFIHDFIDGHTGQYKFCPECGSKNEQWKDGEW